MVWVASPVVRVMLGGGITVIVIESYGDAHPTAITSYVVVVVGLTVKLIGLPVLPPTVLKTEPFLS